MCRDREEKGREGKKERARRESHKNAELSPRDQRLVILRRGFSLCLPFGGGKTSFLVCVFALNFSDSTAAFFSEDGCSCAMAGRITRNKAKTVANWQSLLVFANFMVVNPFKIEVKKKTP